MAASASPDGAFLAVLAHRTGTDSLWLLDLSAGEANTLVHVATVHMIPIRTLRWLPDSSALTYVHWDTANERTQVWLFRPAEGTREFVFEEQGFGIWNAAVSQSGEWLAISRLAVPGELKTKLSLLSLPHCEEVASWVVDRGSATFGFVWDQDGRVLTFPYPHGGVGNQIGLVRVSADGKIDTSVVGTTNGVYAVFPGPCDAKVGYVHGRWGESGKWELAFDVVDVERGTETDTAWPLRSARLAWSPEGDAIAYVSPDGALRIVDLGRLSARLLRPEVGSLVGGHAWASAGEIIVQCSGPYVDSVEFHAVPTDGSPPRIVARGEFLAAALQQHEEATSSLR